MNVRIVPRDAPTRTDLYGGIDGVHSDGTTLTLIGNRHQCSQEVRVPLRRVAEILLDDDPGDWW